MSQSSRLAVTGSGGHVYRVRHDWGNLPPRISYGNTHAVQVDADGLVYIHHTVHRSSQSDHAVVVFDLEGAFVDSWGSQFAGGAHGMQLVREGSEEFFYFCDVRRCIVQKTDLKGNVLLTLGFPMESPAYERNEARLTPSWKPTNLAVADNGDICVADGYGSSFVVVYDRDGRYKTTFGGGRSDGVGQLNCPHGIAIDRRSGKQEVLVADRLNRRLQYFDLDGNHLRFGDGVDLPCHFDFAADGTLLIPDLARRVTLMDGGNRVLTHLGVGPDDWEQRRELEREHFPDGAFVCPHGACFGPEGDIFVTEWVEVGRVTRLEKVS